MELLLLALLAAAAVATEQKPQLPILPEPEPLPPPEPEQVKALMFWNGFVSRGPEDFRRQVIHWTPQQEAALLAGRLICPQGHGYPETELMYTDSIEEQRSTLNEEEEEPKVDWETRENWLLVDSNNLAGTLWCNHPEHQGPRGTTLPQYVIQMLERNIDELEDYLDNKW